MIKIYPLSNQSHLYGVYRQFGQNQEELIAKAVIGETSAPDRIEIDASMDGGYITTEELLEISIAINQERSRQRKPEQFMVASVSQNTNSFGLRGHILVSRKGEAWQVGRSISPADEQWEKGTIVILQPSGLTDWNWAAYGVEIPERLQQAPPDVVADIWKGIV